MRWRGMRRRSHGSHDSWWARRDLNPQGFLHKILSLACLPIPPPARNIKSAGKTRNVRWHVALFPTDRRSAIPAHVGRIRRPACQAVSSRRASVNGNRSYHLRSMTTCQCAAVGALVVEVVGGDGLAGGGCAVLGVVAGRLFFLWSALRNFSAIFRNSSNCWLCRKLLSSPAPLVLTDGFATPDEWVACNA